MVNSNCTCTHTHTHALWQTTIVVKNATSVIGVWFENNGVCQFKESANEERKKRRSFLWNCKQLIINSTMKICYHMELKKG